MGFHTNCICKSVMGFLAKFNNINCNWEVPINKANNSFDKFWSNWPINQAELVG